MGLGRFGRLAFRNFVRSQDIKPALATTDLPTLSYSDGGLLVLPRNYLSGAVTTRASATNIAIAAFQVRDFTDAQNMVRASSITKILNQTWAAGDSAGGLNATDFATGGSGAEANTWYHVFIIKHANGTVDAGFDKSTTATNLLSGSGYTYYRRVGSILTDGSENILNFVQRGNHWTWAAPVGTAVTTINATTAFTITLSGIPTGFRVLGEFNVHATDGNEFAGYLSSLDADDEVPDVITTPARPWANVWGNANNDPSTKMLLRVNASAQIRARFEWGAGTAQDELNFAALGWFDELGRYD